MRRALFLGLIAAVIVAPVVALLSRETHAPEPTSVRERAVDANDGPTLEAASSFSAVPPVAEHRAALPPDSRVEPLQVTVLLPDGTPAAGAWIGVERVMPPDRATSNEPETPLLRGDHVEADALGEAVVSIAYEGPIRVFAPSAGRPWPPHGARSRIVELPRASGNVQLQLEPCSKHWIHPVASNGEKLWGRLRVLDEGGASPRAQAPRAFWRSGVSYVWGELDGSQRVEVDADGYLPRTITLLPLAPGSTEHTQVVLERDATVGWFELAVPLEDDRVLTVLARRTDALDAAWRLLEIRPFVQVTRGSAATGASPELRWPGPAVPRGTYAVLVLSSHSKRVVEEVTGSPAECGWLPALVVGEREVRAKVAIDAGIRVPLAEAQEAARTLRSVRVFAPDGLALPVYETGVPVPQAGPGGAWDGSPRRVRLHDPATAVSPDAVLGPYPFPFVTLWLESTDGSTETVVVGSK